MNLSQRLVVQLDQRKTSGNYRSLQLLDAKLVDFSSNDYLGLTTNKELRSYYSADTNYVGSAGSRLLSGNTHAAMSAEEFLATTLYAESTIVMNSGYTANLSVLSSVPQRGDLIFYDELVHASIKDGMRLSMASRRAFKHNDLLDLEDKLAKSSAVNYVVAESIYSMDGDQCPLIELVSLCRKYNAYLILDEAHATGVLGDHGGGLSEELGLQEEIFCRIFTFGKALGLHGAAVGGSHELIEYLINFARPFIYTTALPPLEYTKIQAHFEYIQSNPFIREQLDSIINFYLQCVKPLNVATTKSSSAIQTVVIPGNAHVKRAALSLQQAGFDVRAICSPTVKEGRERLRICLHSYNSHDEISHLVSSLAAVL